MAGAGLSRGRRLPPSRRRAIRLERAAAVRSRAAGLTLEEAQSGVMGGNTEWYVYRRRSADVEID